MVGLRPWRWNSGWQRVAVGGVYPCTWLFDQWLEVHFNELAHSDSCKAATSRLAVAHQRGADLLLNPVWRPARRFHVYKRPLPPSSRPLHTASAGFCHLTSHEVLGTIYPHSLACHRHVSPVPSLTHPPRYALSYRSGLLIHPSLYLTFPRRLGILIARQDGCLFQLLHQWEGSFSPLRLALGISTQQLAASHRLRPAEFVGMLDAWPGER